MLELDYLHAGMSRTASKLLTCIFCGEKIFIPNEKLLYQKVPDHSAQSITPLFFSFKIEVLKHSRTFFLFCIINSISCYSDPFFFSRKKNILEQLLHLFDKRIIKLSALDTCLLVRSIISLQCPPYFPTMSPYVYIG